jgi:RNA polymerase-binding transcription factor DksA
VKADQARRLLAAERARLEELQRAARHMATMSEEQPRIPVPQLDHSPPEMAVETYEMEKDAAIARRVREDIAEVDAALARVDAGTYGVCEACGRPIDDKRLWAVPAARRCAGDQVLVDHARRR